MYDVNVVEKKVEAATAAAATAASVLQRGTVQRRRVGW